MAPNAGRQPRPGPARVRTSTAGKSRAVPLTPPERLTQDFGLTPPLLAQTSGVSPDVLSRWESCADATAKEKLSRLESVLNGLARVMRRDFIATWLQRPNPAMGGRSPLQLLEAEEYPRIEEMVYRLEAGEPF